MLTWFKLFIMFLSLPAYLGNIMFVIRENDQPRRMIDEMPLPTLLYTFVIMTVFYWGIIGGIGFWFTGATVYYPLDLFL